MTSSHPMKQRDTGQQQQGFPDKEQLNKKSEKSEISGKENSFNNKFVLGNITNSLNYQTNKNFLYLSTMIQLYKNCLNKYPYVTRMFTSGFILSTADFTYQSFIEKREAYDFKRIGVNYTVGFIAAPWLFIWFNKMQPQAMKFLLGKPLNTPVYDKVTKKISFNRLGTKMLLDYFICFPVMQFIYHVNFNILYNKSVQSIQDAFETKANISGTTWNNYVNYLFATAK